MYSFLLWALTKIKKNKKTSHVHHHLLDKVCYFQIALRYENYVNVPWRKVTKIKLTMTKKNTEEHEED